MVNITIFQSGQVTGDCGKIIAYEGQTNSEEIKVLHPSFAGAEYFIEYKYGYTIYRSKLDANDLVTLKIEQADVIQCQFIAVDIMTGNVVFKSKTWYFNINSQLKPNVSHYPCNPHYTLNHHDSINYNHIAHSHCNHNCNSQSAPDLTYMYRQLEERLNNEQEIRYNELTSIKRDIELIKTALNINENISSIIDADLAIEPGTYNADVNSINFPEPNNEYALEVSKSDESNIRQEAYEKDSDNIWYRTGLITGTGEVIWANWAPLISRIVEI